MPTTTSATMAINHRNEEGMMAFVSLGSVTADVGDLEGCLSSATEPTAGGGAGLRYSGNSSIEAEGVDAAT